MGPCWERTVSEYEHDRVWREEGRDLYSEQLDRMRACYARINRVRMILLGICVSSFVLVFGFIFLAMLLRDLAG